MDPPVFVPMPGFTADQTVYIRSYIWSLNNTIWSSNNISMDMDWRPSLQAAFNEYFGLPPLQPLPPLRNLWPQQSTPPAPPAPQEAQKEVEQVKKMALYQATVEDDTEDDNTMPGNKTATESMSTLSTKARLCTAPASRDKAARLTNAPLLDCQQATFLVLLATSLAFFSASQFGYIRCMESMEASGEG